jgi:hypothetical protein
MEMTSIQSWFLLYGDEIPPKDKAWELFPAAYEARKLKYLIEIPRDPSKFMDLADFARVSLELFDEVDCPYDDEHPVSIKVVDNGIRLAQAIQLSNVVVGLDKMLGADGKFAEQCIQSIEKMKETN